MRRGGRTGSLKIVSRGRRSGQVGVGTNEKCSAFGVTVGGIPIAHAAPISTSSRAASGSRFIKRTHRIWDHLTLRVTAKLERDGHRRCDQMIFKEQRRRQDATTAAARRDYLTYLDELLADVVDPPARIAQTVSLALDYLTRRTLQPVLDLPVRSDPRLCAYWDSPSYDYAELFDRFNLWNRPWEYAQMPVVGVITQQRYLPPAPAEHERNTTIPDGRHPHPPSRP